MLPHTHVFECATLFFGTGARSAHETSSFTKTMLNELRQSAAKRALISVRLACVAVNETNLPACRQHRGNRNQAERRGRAPSAHQLAGFDKAPERIRDEAR